LLAKCGARMHCARFAFLIRRRPRRRGTSSGAAGYLPFGVTADWLLVAHQLNARRRRPSVGCSVGPGQVSFRLAGPLAGTTIFVILSSLPGRERQRRRQFSCDDLACNGNLSGNPPSSRSGSLLAQRNLLLGMTRLQKLLTRLVQLFGVNWPWFTSLEQGLGMPFARRRIARRPAGFILEIAARAGLGSGGNQ
jgi:hypothetical protein